MLPNPFSWSWSRHRSFERCRRAYWLQYYASWRGWEGDSVAREIYIQKRLTSVPQWVGQVVHEAAEWALREAQRGECPTPERAVERYRRMAQRQIADSKAGLYRFRPTRLKAFECHYYGTEDATDTGRARIEEQVSSLFDHPVFLRLVDVRRRIVEIEAKERWMIDGVPVWVSLDVLVQDGRGGLSVIDWKTGRPDPDVVLTQLCIYGLYVLDRYSEPGRSGQAPVMGVCANLRDGSHASYRLSAESLSRARNLIRGSAQAMRASLTDPEHNRGDRDAFQELPLGSAECSRCRFRRTCDRE